MLFGKENRMFIYVVSFFFMFFLSSVPMIGAGDAALNAACNRTEAARHQDILKDSFVSLLTGNPVDLEHGIAYGKSLWRKGLNALFAPPAQSKASKKRRSNVPANQKKLFKDMIKENIKKFYSGDELVKKNQFVDGSEYISALEMLQSIESASAILSSDKNINPEFILIQQHYNHFFEQYRFELHGLFPLYQKIVNPLDQSKESYSQALIAFFVELQSKNSQLQALHQKVLEAEEKYLVITTNASLASIVSKGRAQECKVKLQALQSNKYDLTVQEALKMAILKCDDPALTQEGLVRFEMVIDQKDLIPLKPSAHFDRHDAKNLGKLFLVVAVVGAVFYNKYKKDQKAYVDKLRSKIIYAEMPKEKREALLKRLESHKIKFVPHWIRKRTKHDAFDKKVDALYQATRQTKLKALKASKSAASTSKASA